MVSPWITKDEPRLIALRVSLRTTVPVNNETRPICISENHAMLVTCANGRNGRLVHFTSGDMLYVPSPTELYGLVFAIFAATETIFTSLLLGILAFPEVVGA